MKYLFTAILILFLTGCGAQPETDPAINISSDFIDAAEEEIESGNGVNAPDLNAPINLANQNICRTNMQTAAGMITMYMAQHNQPPETFEESGANVSCPEGFAYDYSTDGNRWTIECKAHPSHGSITDGIPNW